MSIGTAILGGGIFAREQHLPAVQEAKALTLKAIWSRSLNSAKSLSADASDVDLYSDDSGEGRSLDDLLARSDIHAVTIALPILSQPMYIRKALSAGKHVLSEKPMAGTVKDAKELLEWYRSEIDTTKVIWSVAENFRFLASYEEAAEARKKMGRALGFRVAKQFMEPGGKYYNTEWRKVPKYQGGFLLDGGVHFIAGMRMMLGNEDPFTSVSAHTAQLQKHLPPVDTVDATLITKSGVTGTISISFGTTFKANEWSVACQEGIVTVGRSTVKINEETKTFEKEGSGVPPEVNAWAEAIASGKPNEKQIPEEALADLELLEAMLRSGEQGGKAIALECQKW